MKLKTKDRVKISDNFYLDEFIHPKIYERFGRTSTRYLNPGIVKAVELVRKGFNEERKMHIPHAKEIGIYINTWGTGGNLINSGVRDFLNPHKKNSRSRHYYSMCADMHLNGARDERELYNHIIKHSEFYFKKGISTIEDFNFTPAWCHISIEWNPWDDKMRIIKP